MKLKLPVLAATLLGAATLPHLIAEVTITRHPSHQVVSLNTRVTNSVTASTTAPPITYQWYGKGALLPDQTGQTLVLNNIQLDQAGEYYVVINDADSQPVQSNPANVTVNPTFEKITEGPLATDVEPTEESTWWDYDNDGDLDLFCSRGEGSRNRLFHNRGDGTFEEILTGSIPNYAGHSYLAAWADYDGDGYLDLFVPNDFQENNLLYRNNHREALAQMGQTNHWLQINLRGTRSNRSGIGAKVRVTATIGGKVVRQLRQIGGQTCAPELFAHFGLGDAPRATTVRVEWPSGAVEEFSNLARDQVYTIVEPALRGAMKPNGEFELSLLASTNRTCTIEFASDLVNWTVLTSVTGQGETPVTYIDTAAPGQNQRFYRMN